MSYPELPAGWEEVSRAGLGPFVTEYTFRRPDGSIIEWTSRRNRKQRGAVDGTGSTWWAPRAMGWWIGVLFAVGSTCFALGALPVYASTVGVFADGITFFVGSVFFTTAAFLQYLEVVNVPRRADGARAGQKLAIITFEPHRPDWWASIVQFVGTVFFNVNTFHAMQSGLDAQAYNQMVFRPDAAGSICFLVASWLCYAEVCGQWFTWRPHSRSWRIGLLNLVGSVFFAISAVASYVVPDSGELRNATWVNLGTFGGALCFLAGAILLLPERTHPEG